MRPLAVLFDLDDTLTSRQHSIERFVHRFADHFASRLESLDRDAVRTAILAADGDGYASRRAMASELVERLLWCDAPSAEEIVTYWNAVFPTCAVLSAGALATLRQLRARSVRLGLITNGAVAVQRAKITALGIREYLEVLVISAAVGIEKPDPRIFRLALDRLGIAPERAWFVGDHPINDVRGATAAGLTPVWLRGRIAWPSDAVPPRHQITTLEQLAALVPAEESAR